MKSKSIRWKNIWLTFNCGSGSSNKEITPAEIKIFMFIDFIIYSKIDSLPFKIIWKAKIFYICFFNLISVDLFDMYLPAEVIFIFILTKYPTFQQKSTPFHKLRAGFFIQNKTRNLKNVLFHTPEEVEIYFNARSSPIWITII